MTKDEIIELAREAGLLAGADMASERNNLFAAGLVKFATLVMAAVVAAERDRLQALTEQDLTLLHRCKAARAYYQYLEPGETPISDVKIVQVHATSQGRSS